MRGPAVSNDGGKTWRWLGAGAVRDQSFTYTCAVDEKEVRFCFAMPYVQENLDAFLFAYRDHPHLHVTPLCKSKKGRDVSRLHKRWHSTQIKPGEGDSGRRARSENGWNEWMENHTLLFQDLRDWIAFDSADCSLTFPRPIFIT